MNIKNFNYLLSKMEESANEILLHSERVSALCYAVGQELNLEPEELEIVYLVGLLHEIGKVGLPSKIKLENEYVDVDKIYPYLTYAILNSYEEYNELKDIIIQHQENIDGTGYPNGLVGTEINTLAIIIRIADFYDSNRMSGLNHDETTKKLRENSDKIFPRKIITPFIKAIIKNELQNEY